LVVLHGDNAQGKTNVLEAVYVLATLKSFRDARPVRWVTMGAPGARIQAIAASGDLSLRLRCSGLVDQAAVEDEALPTKLHQAIEDAREAELDRGQVLVGPHRDELVIQIDGKPARNFASQGQARSIVLALKLAEAEAARARAQHPLFLLDDFTSELDRGRRSRLLELIRTLPGQVWITTTDPAFLGQQTGGDRLELSVEAGVLSGG
jgi:DNA replication and repair protein RecF